MYDIGLQYIEEQPPMLAHAQVQMSWLNPQLDWADYKPDYLEIQHSKLDCLDISSLNRAQINKSQICGKAIKKQL